MQSTGLGRDQITEYAQRSVELSLSTVEAGGIPFAALVVEPRRGIIGSGVNRVAIDRDPLAHAEVVAIRDAGKHRPSSRCTLIASGEPCALCYMAALYAGIGQVVYVVGRDEAARYGFDYRDSYRLFGTPPDEWRFMDVRPWPMDNGLAPFVAFRERHGG